jgi:hypothetical protein
MHHGGAKFGFLQIPLVMVIDCIEVLEVKLRGDTKLARLQFLAYSKLIRSFLLDL